MNATYNKSGDVFLNGWLRTTGLTKAQLPQYYWDLQVEVGKMNDDDAKDIELMAKLRAAGVADDKLKVRATFIKNEICEARRRDIASKDRYLFK